MHEWPTDCPVVMYMAAPIEPQEAGRYTSSSTAFVAGTPADRIDELEREIASLRRRMRRLEKTMKEHS